MLQVQYHELCEQGLGTVVKHAPAVTPDEEDALWRSKVIGDHDPAALQRAVFLRWQKFLPSKRRGAAYLENFPVCLIIGT